MRLQFLQRRQRLAAFKSQDEDAESMRTVKAPFTDAQLSEIIFRAGTLYERLETAPAPVAVPSADRERIEVRLRKWREFSAAGDAHRFAERLAQLGHTIETIRPYLSSKIPPPSSTPSGSRVTPPWAKLLQQTMSWVREHHDGTGTSLLEFDFLDPADPIPFEHLLAPMVEFSRKRLAENHRSSMSLLSGKAMRLFHRYLLRLLSFAAAEPLFVEFSLFLVQRRRTGATGRMHHFPMVDGAGESNLSYLRFCRELLQHGLCAFFLEYSFLARRLATFMEFWEEATGEFLERLAADLPKLARHFHGGRSPGKVDFVRLGISDRHNRGRSVIMVHFAGGLRVVYKPKDIRLEKAFFEFVRSPDGPCAAAGDVCGLRTLRTLVCRGYGWVECADDHECDEAVQLQRFFLRSGQLMGLLFGLNGYDYHSENLIASGEHPVPVDLETLFGPVAPSLYRGGGPREEKSPDTATHHSSPAEPLYTVLTSGYLPYWSGGPNDAPFDQSGFGGFLDQGAEQQVRIFTAINTDHMEMVLQPFEMEKPRNLPHHNGTAVLPDKHLPSILTGFEESHRFWQSIRSSRTRSKNLSTRFSNLKARHLFRNTRIYATLLGQTNRLEFLREAIDASLLWDGMSRAFQEMKPGDPMLAILEAEHRALAVDDIPVFYAVTHGRTLRIPGGARLPKHFLYSGRESFLRHLKHFDAADAERQSELIRQAFLARQAGALEAVDHAPAPAPSGPEIRGPAMGAERLVDIAVSLARQIVSRAFPDARGNVHWFGLQPNTQTRRLELGLVNSAFYQGQGGIAVFLAAMEKALPGQGYRKVALAALRSLRQELRALEKPPREDGKVSLGGMAGLGSLVYALLTTGSLLQDQGLLEDAARMAGFLQSPVIREDSALDIVGGSAGAILSLLALYHQTKHEDVLNQAVTCGRHLLDRRIAARTGLRAWPTLEGKLLAGFSHGAAGISYALNKLSGESGLAAFAEAASEGREYESTLFDKERSNWPDFRSGDNSPSFLNQWCHGATGIGYSRLGLLNGKTMAYLEKEVGLAVELTIKDSLLKVDHLCCGNMGQISFLFDAARRMRRPEWAAAAQLRLEKLLAWRDEGRSFRLFATLPAGPFHPGFMQGAAGIGYALLRIARPELQLPCCLLLE